MNRAYKRIIFIVLVIISTLNLPDQVKADIVYLKNGKKMEGLIKEETDKYIKLELGFGTTKIFKSKIKGVSRSSDQEIDSLKQEWIVQNKERVESQQKRREIQKATTLLNNQPQIKKKIKEVVKKVSRSDIIKYIQRRNSIGVEAILNNKVKVQLIVDTGASDVFLRPYVKKKLGLGLITRKVPITLADGSRTDGEETTLKTVKVGNLTVKNIHAIFLSDAVGSSTWDGALGMSFLEHFEVKIDAKNKKLILNEKGSSN